MASTAASLALVLEECAFQSDEVFTWPLASVTTTWASPVASLVTRNGTPAMRWEVASATFTNSKSPRFTWLRTASSPSSTTISPSERIWNSRSAVSLMR